MPEAIEMFRLEGLPDFAPGDDVADAIITLLDEQKKALQQGDILVIAHKVISKSEGAIRFLQDVEPGSDAIELARTVNKDPRKVQVVLDQSTRIVRAVSHAGHKEGVLIAEHKLGHVCANAAVDESNADQEGMLITLPDDPDSSARQIADKLNQHYGITTGVVISDTFGRPWRLGQTNVAIGVASIPALMVMEGETDAYGRPLTVTAPAFADELAGASGLLMEKSAATPVIIFRGLHWTPCDSSSRDLIRSAKEDLFR